ncbi:DNA helicase [Tanacetum coccineum]
MSGRDYVNCNGDQSCEEGCFDYMWPRNSNTTVDGNVFNSGSTHEYISNFEESIQTRPRSSVDVQILGNGNNVSTHLSSGGHDMVDITLVSVTRIFDRFRNMGSNTLRSHSMSQAAADNLVNDGSIQENIPISEETIRKREPPFVDVRILIDSGNVSTWMSTGCHDVVPTTTVPISRIFDRFRNMCLNNVGSDYMSHVGLYSWSIIGTATGITLITDEVSNSNIHKRGCLHNVSTPSSIEENVHPETIRARDSLGHTVSSSRTATVNHAYLCMDVTDCIIRPQIVNFPHTNATNVYQSHVQGEYSDTTHCRILHSEASAINDCSTLGTEKAQNISQSQSLQTRMYNQSSSSRNVPRRSQNQGDTMSYIDLGDCDQECRHCGCLFWYNERLKGNDYGGRAEYHLCCGGAKIYMPLMPDPPVFIQQLLRNSHFMDHVRAYNQMFSMTSFGAKIDDSINRGRGPYVFKDEVANRMQNFQGRDEDTLNPEIVEGLIHIVYTIEFHKRGLPHCHTLLWVDSSSKIRNAVEIDEYISAGIPDPVEDPKGYKVVTELMMHGPCGPYRIIAKVNRLIGDTSTSTACWRIFEFPIHCREPAVQILNVHLENAQRVTFCERDRIDIIINMPEKKKTTLTEWYVYNNENTNGRHLTYLDFPSEFLWYPNSKGWRRRVMKTKKSLGRLSYVHPNSGEPFYFRMLVSHQKGCKSPTEVRTVHGYVFPTYKAACEALGLLGDDKEWDIALDESIMSASSVELRTLFAQILIYCDVSNPLKLRTKYWTAMKDDIPAKVSEATGILNYYVNTHELQGYILYELEAILNGFGKSVKDFGLPPPPERLLKDLRNKLLMEERNYKRDLLMHDVANFLPQLNHDQKEIYNLIINASKESLQELLFVYGHGGTGKTFLWKTIISSLRSQGKFILAVASSGIASLLLPAGRTTHSRFKLPLDLTDESVCHAKKHSQLANLLIETYLIIWDEAPMNDRRCFEALDKTLRDLMNAPEIVFGGKIVVFGGDFRQTLPVKKGVAKEELINVSIAQSYLWSHFKICKLKENMRLLRTGLSYEERERFEIFAKWLLDVGNGEIGKPDENNDEDTSWVTISQQYCLTPGEQGLSELIDFIYDDATLKAPTASTLQEKAIVCPKNDTADVMNAKILSIVKSTTKTYLSRDEAIPMGGETRPSIQKLVSYLPWNRCLSNGQLYVELSEANIAMMRSTKMSQANIASLKLGQENCVLEAKVYQKWISKSIPKRWNKTRALSYYSSITGEDTEQANTTYPATTGSNKLQGNTVHVYNFKATVTDATATAELTFFTEAGEKISHGEIRNNR